MAALEIIAALSENFVIGNKGDIPWHLSEDLKHFKNITTGHPVVMGRRTFESIGRVLPNRLNILVSSTFEKQIEGLKVVRSLKEAMALATDSSLMVIGGARMYAEALPLADVLHLTRIRKSIEGDTYFPRFSEERFELTASEQFHSQSCGFDYVFETWKARK